METLYRKVALSDIEEYKWYLRDCENGYYDMFYCKNIEDKTVSGIGIINNETDNDLEFEKHYFLSDFFELKEIPDPTAQLKADKEELLEALEIFIEQNTPTFTSHDYEFPEHVMKAKSLIKKHKQ